MEPYRRFAQYEVRMGLCAFSGEKVPQTTTVAIDVILSLTSVFFPLLTISPFSSFLSRPWA